MNATSDRSGAAPAQPTLFALRVRVPGTGPGMTDVLGWRRGGSPHPALRATFSPEGRRGSCALLNSSRHMPSGWRMVSLIAPQVMQVRK